jgi:muramoyltetrapeptide carboxypeptidase
MAMERAGDLLWALEDDDIKAIICSRGGYGTLHLLRLIPREKFREHPKWIVGNGDITTLLYGIASQSVQSIYGPMAFQMAFSQGIDAEQLRNILFGVIPQYHLPSHSHNICGHGEGVLIGGNLTSFNAVAGTGFYQILEGDTILFFEEVEESLHNIDRMFYTLMLQKAFWKVKGVIFGMFMAVRYDLEFNSVEHMLVYHLRNLGIPVCCGLPTGSNVCLPLIEGAPCTLDVTPEGSTITFHIEGGRQNIVNLEENEQQLMKQ